MAEIFYTDASLRATHFNLQAKYAEMIVRAEFYMKTPTGCTLQSFNEAQSAYKNLLRAAVVLREHLNDNA